MAAAPPASGNLADASPEQVDQMLQDVLSPVERCGDVLMIRSVRPDGGPVQETPYQVALRERLEEYVRLVRDWDHNQETEVARLALAGRIMQVYTGLVAGEKQAAELYRMSNRLLPLRDMVDGISQLTGLRSSLKNYSSLMVKHMHHVNVYAAANKWVAVELQIERMIEASQSFVQELTACGKVLRECTSRAAEYRERALQHTEVLQAKLQNSGFQSNSLMRRLWHALELSIFGLSFAISMPGNFLRVCGDAMLEAVSDGQPWNSAAAAVNVLKALATGEMTLQAAVAGIHIICLLGGLAARAASVPLALVGSSLEKWYEALVHLDRLEEQELSRQLKVARQIEAHASAWLKECNVAERDAVAFRRDIESLIGLLEASKKQALEMRKEFELLTGADIEDMPDREERIFEHPSLFADSLLELCDHDCAGALRGEHALLARQHLAGFCDVLSNLVDVRGVLEWREHFAAAILSQHAYSPTAPIGKVTGLCFKLIQDLGPNVEEGVFSNLVAVEIDCEASGEASQLYPAMCISFRGSAHAKEWVINSNFKPDYPFVAEEQGSRTFMHQGYWREVEAMVRWLLPILLAALKQRPFKRLLFAGHSYGGAIACTTLIWIYHKLHILQRSELPPEALELLRNAQAVCFGAPQVGGTVGEASDFAKGLRTFMEARVTHYVYRNDMVGRLFRGADTDMVASVIQGVSPSGFGALAQWKFLDMAMVQVDAFRKLFGNFEHFGQLVWLTKDTSVECGAELSPQGTFWDTSKLSLADHSVHEYVGVLRDLCDGKNGLRADIIRKDGSAKVLLRRP